VASLLERARSTSETDSWPAIFALADNSSAESIEGLVRLFESEEKWLRRAAVFAIGENENGGDAADVIHKALEDKSFHVVWAGIEAAEKLQLVEANKKIVQLLKARDPVQRAALSALKAIWLPTNFEPVFQVFLNSKSDKNRKEAAWTLRAIADNNCWEELFEAWRNDEVPRHRTWACELAGLYGNRETVEELSALEQDNNGHVRDAASNAIKKLRG
jgi:HEAT repeat protein